MDRLERRWGYTGRCIFGADIGNRVDFDLNEIDYIVFLQTDIFRERHYYVKEFPTDTETKWKILEQEFVDSLQMFDSLEQMFDEYFSKLYTKLNSFDKPVLCIGGWSQLHPSIKNYSNLISVITSSTKLLIPDVVDDVYLSDPEWFLQLSQDEMFMKKFGQEFKHISIASADKLQQIYDNWHEVHPDITGYQKIVDELLNYLV